MSTLSYPSEAFPGPPEVALDIPDGWSPLRVSGTLLGCRRIVSHQGIAPHVVIRGSRRSVDYTERRALQELRDFVDAQPEGRVDDPFEIELDGTPFVGVTVSWKDPEIGTIVQIHLFTCSRRDRGVDLIQATGSVAGSDVRSAYADVQQILRTIRVSR